MTREEWAIVQAPFAAPAIGALEAAVGREMRDLAEIEGHKSRLPQMGRHGTSPPSPIKMRGMEMLASGASVAEVARCFRRSTGTVRDWRADARLRGMMPADAAILSGGAG